MDYHDVVRDFAERTKKNLHTIERLRAEGEEVYESTQLINSMLGLLVFPREEFIHRIPETPFAELVRNGWPAPKVRDGFRQATDLRQLVRYMRNAIAHFNMVFLADEERKITGVRLWNTRQGQRDWEAELTLEDLREIADRFIQLLVEDKRQ